MNIGARRHRIKIQSQNPAANVNPFSTVCSTDSGWTDVFTCWACIKPLSGKEAYQVGQQNMKVSHTITIRFPGVGYSVSAGNRVLYKTRIFELQTGIENPEEKNIDLILLAYEIDPTQVGGTFPLT
jgi:SPP1 family predicted phage head-tail adaptor